MHKHKIWRVEYFISPAAEYGPDSFPLAPFHQYGCADVWWHRNWPHEEGKHDEAIQAYDKAIQLKPDYAEAYNNKGTALRSQGKYDEALQSYDKAIQLKPDYAEAYSNKRVAPNSLGKYDEAIKALDKAIQLKPDYSEAYYYKGITLSALGRISEANAAVGKAKEQGYKG